MDISVILPTYCESGNIGHLIEAIEENLSAPGRQVEIIVVDDASPDGTAEVVQKVAALPGITIRCLVRTEERGLASAIRYGLDRANGRRILVMDTDFNHSPDNLNMMAAVLDKFDLVIGSRFVRGGGMEDQMRYYASLIFNVFIRVVLWVPVHDNLCGFFAIKRERLNSLPLDAIFSGYGEYFIRLVYLAYCKGFKIHEIPVFYTLRKTGESKSHFGSMIRDYTRTTFQLRFGAGRQ